MIFIVIKNNNDKGSSQKKKNTNGNKYSNYKMKIEIIVILLKNSFSIRHSLDIYI